MKRITYRNFVQMKCGDVGYTNLESTFIKTRKGGGHEWWQRNKIRCSVRLTTREGSGFVSRDPAVCAGHVHTYDPGLAGDDLRHQDLSGVLSVSLSLLD